MRVFRPKPPRSKVTPLLGIGLAILMLGLAVLLAQLTLTKGPSYRVERGTVTLDSGTWFDGKRVFAVSDITDVRVVAIHGGVRTHGTGMPGLCAGDWTLSGIGPVWEATTCASRGVLVTATGQERPLLASPPDPDAFAAAVRAGEDTFVSLPAPNLSMVRVLPGAFVGLALVFAVLFVVGPGRLRYVVDGGDVRIETLFTRRTYAARELRAQVYVPHVGLRVWGTSFPGYHTGLFREGGQTTRIYATNIREEGVLLESSERVFLSPADPRAFLAALEHAGARVA